MKGKNLEELLNKKIKLTTFNGNEYEKLRKNIIESQSDSYCPVLKFCCVYKNSAKNNLR